MGKKVAIIGAGASGLTAIKCCLDECLEPCCFERSDDIGGLWNYTEKASGDGHPSVMRSTVINTSKEIMCFSDFPIPKEYPIYMHNTYVQKYFDSYANNFNLRPYIRFKTEVVSLKRSDTFRDNGTWEIKIKDLETEKEETDIYDAVMICTGHHAYRYIPQFEGLDKFTGKVLHSNVLRDQRGYDGKRVVIIGIGNSGGDAAVELGRVASKMFLSTRRGTWILHRVAERGMPIDMSLSRAFNVIMKTLPTSYVSSKFEGILNERIDHEVYSLKPNYPPSAQHPMVNDDLPNKIIAGLVTIKPNVRRFTETGVEFDDGTVEDNIDVVILATGYSFKFSFLEKGLLDTTDNKLELFKYVFHPDLTKQTLAMIGYVQPLGAINPIAELQCRLATRVFKGDVTLPSKETMWQDIVNKQDSMARRYVKSRRHTIQVQFLPYMDELAELAGCKPNFNLRLLDAQLEEGKRLLKFLDSLRNNRATLHSPLKVTPEKIQESPTDPPPKKVEKLFLTEPMLAWRVIFGPPTPYQYRLMGHGKWDGAKNAIETAWERTLFPLKTRQVPTPMKKKSGHFPKILLIAVVFAAVLYKLFM